MRKLEGIVAPMATALTPDGGIDQKRTRTLVDFLIEDGIDALFQVNCLRRKRIMQANPLNSPRNPFRDW